MGASHSKVVVDHESDLSSSQKPVLFLGFLFLETDLLLLELGVLDNLVQSRSNLRVQHLEIRDDFNSSMESTISNSLIHNMVSEGKSEQVVT